MRAHPEDVVPVQQHLQLSNSQCHGIRRLFAGDKLEMVFLKPFQPKRKPRAIEIQHFQQIAPFVDEHKKAAIEGRQRQIPLRKGGQGVDVLPPVDSMTT